MIGISPDLEATWTVGWIGCNVGRHMRGDASYLPALV